MPEPGLPTLKRLPLKSSNFVTFGFLARQHRERLGMHRDRPRAGRRKRLVLELPLALDRLVLHVRLRHAEVELAGLDGVDVEGRAAGRFHRAADAVLGAVLVDQPADRAAHRVVDAGDAAGADGDEFLLRGSRPALRRASAAPRRRRISRQMFIASSRRPFSLVSVDRLRANCSCLLAPIPEAVCRSPHRPRRRAARRSYRSPHRRR